MNGCPHADVTVVNPYELIRKYECAACRAVMMCACDEAYGRRDLPHQLAMGKRLDTQERVAVTHGFVAGICNTCRGIPEPAAPKAAIHGRTSKILRYYWREIAKETAERFARWARSRGLEPSFELRGAHRSDYERIEDEVVADIKRPTSGLRQRGKRSLTRGT